MKKSKPYTTGCRPRRLNHYYVRYVCYGDNTSAVGIATGYRLVDRMIGARFPAESGNISLLHRVQIGTAAHPASYPISTRGSFPGDKAAGTWSWPLTPMYWRGQECMELHSPNTLSIRGAQLKKHRDNSFTFTESCAHACKTCGELRKAHAISRIDLPQ